MLTRWNDVGFGGFGREWSALDDLRSQMDRLLWDFERGRESGRDSGQGLRWIAGTGWPRVGLYDAGSELQLRAEVPGLSEKELDISVDQNTLSIRGERKTRVPEGYAVHRQERGDRAFARSFTLPCRIDTEKATAKLRNGVLEMALPKVAEEQPRQIQVQVV